MQIMSQNQWGGLRCQVNFDDLSMMVPADEQASYLKEPGQIMPHHKIDLITVNRINV
jgi:hypothetical protein